MTAASLRQKLIVLLPFKRRKSLRSPRRTKRLLRWAMKADYPLAHVFVTGWPRLLIGTALAYFIFTRPAHSDVRPQLDEGLRYLQALVAFIPFLNTEFRTKKTWWVRRRRATRAEFKRKLNALDERYVRPVD